MGEILLVEVARVSRRERVVETQPQSDLRRGYRLYEDSRGARFRLGVGGLGEHRGWGGRGFRRMARRFGALSLGAAFVASTISKSSWAVAPLYFASSPSRPSRSSLHDGG